MCVYVSSGSLWLCELPGMEWTRRVSPTVFFQYMQYVLKMYLIYFLEFVSFVWGVSFSDFKVLCLFFPHWRGAHFSESVYWVRNNSWCTHLLCFSLLASGSDDQHAIVWDPFRHKKLITMHTGHAANIFSVKVTIHQTGLPWLQSLLVPWDTI